MSDSWRAWMKPRATGLFNSKAQRAVTDWATVRNWVLTRDDRVCQICRVSVATEVDHIWPRKYGGPDHHSNLQAVCLPCNRIKGDRVVWEFANEVELNAALNAVSARVDRELAALATISELLAARSYYGGVRATLELGVLKTVVARHVDDVRSIARYSWPEFAS